MSTTNGQPETPGLAARVEDIARRFTPDTGRARSVMGAGWRSLRETRDYARVLRKEWRGSGLGELGPVPYGAWRRERAMTRESLRMQRRLSATIREPIGVHVIVLADGEGERERSRVGRTLESLGTQTWGHVHGTVLGGAAAASATAGRGDPRWVFRPATRDEFAAVVDDLVAGIPDRDLLLFLSPDDRLEDHACFWLSEAARDDPAVDLVTFDDDVLGPGGRPGNPRLRPSWSPETLLGADYLAHSFALRRRRFVAAGGLRPEFGAAMFWDLLLRADLDDSAVERIEAVLLHQAARTVAPATVGAAAVDEHLRRHGLAASARADGECVRIDWDLEHPPTVSVIIPTRHNRPMLDQLLPGLVATDYPNLEVVVIDNGGQTDERDEYYTAFDLDLRVEWWNRPFNFSGVNNYGARLARGDVIVFLNDDIELPDPGWLRHLVGWATQPEIGTVGLQLRRSDGTIQHGGVILGLNGFADHLFEGMTPDSPSLLGPTSWYRNTLAVTAACVAVRKTVFDEIGGFDERFELTGSDVVLGLDSVIGGYRNVCVPFGGVRHHEAATRGGDVPPGDFFASYWRYQRWIFAGDPYFSHGLSLLSREPRLRSTRERPPSARLAEALNRPMKVFRQTSDMDEALMLADECRVTESDIADLAERHARNAAPSPPESVMWFFPDFDSPFYGGINTALRMADSLRRDHGVESRFAIWSEPNDAYFRSAFVAAFPGLADAPIYFHNNTPETLDAIPPCDAAVASLWTTAYSVARFHQARRAFYLIQDFEPMFYPAGTVYALAEETYKLGLYGLCNNPHMLDLYQQRYRGVGGTFTPAVDSSVFHANGRRDAGPGEPATVFLYARPGHWRNCWELALPALRELKERLEDRVRIITAGSWARPEDLGAGIRHMGLLDYKETGHLYRTCDIGVALTVSEHPSYLPIELMASGAAVVAFDNPDYQWILRNGENSLLARRTVDGLGNTIERLVVDAELRHRLRDQGLRDIARDHGDWNQALADIHPLLSDPEARDRR